LFIFLFKIFSVSHSRRFFISITCGYATCESTGHSYGFHFLKNIFVFFKSSKGFVNSFYGNLKTNNCCCNL
jgi:hypothetical protein